MARGGEWDKVLASLARARRAARSSHEEIRGPGPAWQGCAEGIDTDGYLQILTDDGVRRRVISGEIRLVD